MSLFMILEVSIHYFHALRVGTSGHPSSYVEANVEWQLAVTGNRC